MVSAIDSAQRQRLARIAALRAALAARADQPPPADWLPVVVGGHEVGTTSPEIAGFLRGASERFGLRDGRLVVDDAGLDADRRSALLAGAARALHAAGLLRGWRGEVLPVRTPAEPTPIAFVERAACRPLGLTTTAVHLCAFTAGADLIIARRAAHKQIDPGCWDTLVGGMVAAGESEEQTLAREALEEAGLDLAPLAPVRGGRLHVRRRVAEGYQSEIVQVFDALIPQGTRLVNRDGEVATIERRDPQSVLAAIAAGQFTLEAALATLDALARRCRGRIEDPC
jgi:8-oxo-dGTP pyrophosphatase MutT (NUDIX family)